MSFESERLRILERVSNGELTPQEGSLEIAMLRVQHPDEGLTSGPTGPERDAEPENPDAAIPRATPWPLVVALTLPLLLIGGLMVGGLALFLALPTYLFVAAWNHLAAGGGPALAFWPTLAGAVALFALLTLLRWRRRLRQSIERRF